MQHMLVMAICWHIVDGIRVDDQGVLHVHIVEGIVEDIIPAGNKKTRDKVITRESFKRKVNLSIILGTPFCRTRIQPRLL